MIKIVLIRPGSTDLDEQGRVQGTIDVPISERGNVVVTRLVEELKNGGIEVIYSAGGQASRETAEVLATGLDIKLKKLENMQNLDHGLWQGMTIDEIRHKHPKVYRQWQEQPQTVCPPNGEMLSVAETRVRVSLAKLLKRHKQGTFAIVVPEPLAQLVRCQIAACERGNLWTSGSDREQWEVFEIKPRELVQSS